VDAGWTVVLAPDARNDVREADSGDPIDDFRVPDVDPCVHGTEWRPGNAPAVVSCAECTDVAQSAGRLRSSGTLPIANSRHGRDSDRRTIDDVVADVDPANRHSSFHQTGRRVRLAASRRPFMRYLLLIYNAESDEQPSQDAVNASLAAYGAFTADIAARGLFQVGEALTPTSTATTVRVVDGETVTTDGPFAETKEALGGFYLIDARDLDEAIETAAKIPGAALGSVEVRPIWERPAGYAMSGGAEVGAAG
jgi:hypothetical protein